MIVRSFYMERTDGVKLYVSYSDSGMKIRQDQTGIVYDAAVDVETASYTYAETDEPVDEPVDPTPPEEMTIPAQTALDIILGEG